MGAFMLITAQCQEFKSPPLLPGSPYFNVSTMEQKL